MGEDWKYSYKPPDYVRNGLAGCFHQLCGQVKTTKTKAFQKIDWEAHGVKVGVTGYLKKGSNRKMGYFSSDMVHIGPKCDPALASELRRCLPKYEGPYDPSSLVGPTV